MNNHDQELWPESLNLFDYFEGQTKAFGLFKDRFGTVRRRFIVTLEGMIIGDELQLSEHFEYDDGEVEDRVWLIVQGRDGYFEGRSDDVVGVAKGVVRANNFNWQYEMLLTIQGRKVAVSFNDWMHVLPNDVLLNQATVSKFGIKLGTVFISFYKQQ